jgi:hypothetical protein
MSSRNPIAVAKKHMAEIEQWTVHKVLKMQITLGTALYMVWSADDQKRYTPKGVVGNVRDGLLQAITGGVHIFLCKDHTVRKVQTSNLSKVIEISNSIFSSGLAVHRNDKTLAHQEPLGVTSSAGGRTQTAKQKTQAVVRDKTTLVLLVTELLHLLRESKRMVVRDMTLGLSQLASLQNKLQKQKHDIIRLKAILVVLVMEQRHQLR